MGKTSIYYLASKAGVPVGMMLTAMSACFIFSRQAPSLSIVMMLIFLSIPGFMTFKMRMVAREYPEFRKLAALWVYGIYSFIFGTLICALLTAGYLLLVEPGFLYNYMSETVEGLSRSPLATEYSEQITVMRRALEQNLVPSPMEFVISIGWATCFGGSVLSLPLAAIVSRKTGTMQIPAN